MPGRGVDRVHFHAFRAHVGRRGDLASCTLGPDYKRPVVETPAVHRGAASAQATAESLADLKWFELFRDEQLTALVTTALKQNFELRIAAERVLQARAVLWNHAVRPVPAGRSVRRRHGQHARRKSARNRAIPVGADTGVSYIQAGFSLGWELDVWGRLRRLDRSRRARSISRPKKRAAASSRRSSPMSPRPISRCARSISSSRSPGARATSATDSLRLIEARRDQRRGQRPRRAAGGAAALHGDGADRQHRARDRAGRERAEPAARSAPGDVPRGRALEAFEAPPTVPAGLPSALLERRPDIRQAEQELVAANAQIGAAKAEYFPRISLTGFLGAQSRALTDPPDLARREWPAPASARRRRSSTPDGRAATCSSPKPSSASARELSSGSSTSRSAMCPTRSSATRRPREQRDEQERLVQALRESARAVDPALSGGLDSYLPVLDAQRNLFEGELDLARLRQRELASIVQLYRALGGGWVASGMQLPDFDSKRALGMSVGERRDWELWSEFVKDGHMAKRMILMLVLDDRVHRGRSGS